MPAPYMTGSHLSLHKFHASPTEKIRHFPIHSVMYVDEPVRAVPRWGELARVQPRQTAVEAFAGRMGILPEQTHRAAVHTSPIS